MIGFDTNVLLRWIASDFVGTEDARNQSLLIEKLIAANHAPIFVNHVVLAESVWVLRRHARLSKQMLIDVIVALLNSENVVIDDRETVVSALHHYREQPGDFPDHLIGEINRRQGCSTTMTFDKAAAKSPQFTVLRS